MEQVGGKQRQKCWHRSVPVAVSRGPGGRGGRGDDVGSYGGGGADGDRGGDGAGGVRVDVFMFQTLHRKLSAISEFCS